MARKIYERYFGASKAVTEGVGAAIVLKTGDTSIVTSIDFPHEAEIKKLVVVQTNGTTTAFSVDLFNNKTLIGTASEAVAKVLATLASSSKVAEVFTANSGYPFRNTEGTQSVPVRKIYLRIAIASAAGNDLTFEAAIAGEPQMGV